MIIHGDCLDVMMTMEDNSIDFIVTDPPYGLHFMGKDWDGRLPAIEIWSEALRICKPGAMLAAFGGSRTHHHLMCAIEGGGWEIRDVIMWIYGQGFPKSHNFGRKLGKKWEGYGTSLKPAYEPIILAMKPLDGTYAQNGEKWGVAGINIDDCRIETKEDLGRFNKDLGGISPFGVKDNSTFGTGKSKQYNKPIEQQGRWPANIIFDEEAAKELDEMTGILKSGNINPSENEPVRGIYLHGRRKRCINQFQASAGGASRFFYCAKASSSERGKGNNHPTVKPIALMKYILKLLAPPSYEKTQNKTKEYENMESPSEKLDVSKTFERKFKGPICLDPFAGSGSTVVAATELGIHCIGIEKEGQYVPISKAREAAALREPLQYELPLCQVSS